MKRKIVKVFNNSGNDLPQYGSEFAAGIDLRADFSKIENINDIIGNDMYIFDKDDNDNLKIILEPQGRILIPTNLHISIPDDYEVQVRPRSGLALKHGITIVNSPGTVDADYKGVIGIILLNTDVNKSFEINQGDRIAQAVLSEVKQIKWKEVDTLEGLGESERGQGGFGSTGKK